jgi:hypothetical protein
VSKSQSDLWTHVLAGQLHDLEEVESDHLDSKFLRDVRSGLSGAFGHLDPIGLVAD